MHYTTDQSDQTSIGTGHVNILRYFAIRSIEGGAIGLYRDVWVAAIASSRTRLATLSGVMCNTSQCELRSLRVNSGMLNVIRIVTYYTLPPLESSTSSWIAILTILNEAFTRVRRDVALQSNDYEMVDFVMRRFQQWTGLGQLFGAKKTSPQDESNDGKPTLPGHEIDKLTATVDRFLAAVSKVYFNQDTFYSYLETGNGNKQAVKTTLSEERARMERMVSEGRPVQLPDVDYSS